jgi:hypothetical protein
MMSIFLASLDITRCVLPNFMCVGIVCKIVSCTCTMHCIMHCFLSVYKNAIICFLLKNIELYFKF